MKKRQLIPTLAIYENGIYSTELEIKGIRQYLNYWETK